MTGANKPVCNGLFALPVVMLLYSETIKVTCSHWAVVSKDQASKLVTSLIKVYYSWTCHVWISPNSTLNFLRLLMIHVLRMTSIRWVVLELLEPHTHTEICGSSRWISLRCWWSEQDDSHVDSTAACLQMFHGDFPETSEETHTRESSSKWIPTHVPHKPKTRRPGLQQLKLGSKE